MTQLFKNNASGSLASNIGTTDTLLALATGHGARFPAPMGGDHFLMTLIGVDANGNESAWEIVKVTGRSSDALTIVRAQEGTLAAPWLAGTRVEIRATAGTFGGFLPALGGNSLSLGTTTSYGKFNTYSLNPGSPATSGTTDAAINWRMNVNAIALDFGVYTTGTAWIQNRLVSDFANNYSLAINPNGGHVSIGTAANNLLGIGGSRSLTLSAGVTTEAIASLELQGARGAENAAFAGVSFYHKTTRVAAINSTRGSADDEGDLRFYTKTAGGSLTEQMVISPSGIITFTNGFHWSGVTGKPPLFGDAGSTWYYSSSDNGRFSGTWYQNTSGKVLCVYFNNAANFQIKPTLTGVSQLQLAGGASGGIPTTLLVPNGWYYRINSWTGFWWEIS